MRRTMRRREDRERRQLNQGLDVRLAIAARPARQRLIAPGDSLRIVNDPAPAAARCLVAVAGLDPSDDVAESARASRGHKGAIRVGTVEVPRSAPATDEARDHPEAVATLELESSHLIGRRTLRLIRRPRR